MIATITRDVVRYLQADDPNHEVAGQQALKSLNACIRVLSQVRHHLLIEMHGTDETATRYGARPIREPGNSGPGF